MFAQAFRFDSGHFRTRAFRHAFEPRKPRARWARVLLGLVGVAVLAVLVMFSVVVGAAMVAAGLLYRLWHRRNRPIAREQRVVDAEYRVIDKARLPR